MASFLCADYKVSSPVKVLQQVSAAQQQLGGPLDRETFITLGANTYIQNNSHVHKTFARVFIWHKDKIYQFDGNAFYVPIGTLSGSFTFLKGGAWTATGPATGTFLEDFVTGDLFAKVLIATGTLGSGATITVTTGSHTCVTGAAAVQRGVTGQLGEWGIVHTLPSVPVNDYFISGLHTVNANGKSTMCGFYSPAAATVRGFTYDPDTDLFTDTAVSGTITGLNGTNRGVCDVVGNSLVWWASHTTNQRFLTLHFNPVTGTFFSSTSGAGQIHVNADGLSGTGYTHALFEGRLFAGLPSGAGNNFNVYELTGGDWGRILFFDGSTSANVPDFQPASTAQGEGGSHMIVHQDKLLIIGGGDMNTAGSRGWFIAAMSLLSGTLTCDNAKTTEAAANVIGAADQFEALANWILPGLTLPIGGSTNLPNAAKIRFYRDEMTNDPDGDDIMECWFLGNTGAGGNSNVLQLKKLIADLPTLTLDWDNIVLSAGDTYTLPTNNDATTELGAVITDVGPWVIDPNGRWFRVSAINGGVPEIEIENPASHAFGSGTSDRFVDVSTSGVVNVGIDTGVATLAVPHGNLGGGGGIFTKGDKGFMFLGETSLATDVQISFKCNDPAGGNVDVELFHAEGDKATNTQTPLSTLAGGGSLALDKISGFPGDGTIGTVRHTAPTNGIQYKRGAKLG